MKIDSGQLPTTIPPKKAESRATADATKDPSGGAADRIDLSRSSGRAARLTTIMRQMAESQQEKIAQIKQQIGDGSYRVAASETAGRMLDRWRGLYVS